MDYWSTFTAYDVVIGGLRDVRLFYRARQLWQSLFSVASLDEIAIAHKELSPALTDLFLTLQPNEQRHSLWVYQKLLEQGDAQKDLLISALLHDLGKSCYPLRPWERIAVVLGKSLFPECVKRWGKDSPRGWKRPFVVAENHASWGAEMALEAGASPLVVSLIRRHHDPRGYSLDQPENQFLYQLQLLDNES
jgi:hypothetical protein